MIQRAYQPKLLNKMARAAGIETALTRFWRPPLYR